jgi:hypothetical protein
MMSAADVEVNQGCQTFYRDGSHLLLWSESRAARVETTANGIIW